MKTVATEWLVYSESGVPFWLVLIGLVLILWSTRACLRRELRGKSGLWVRLLPVSLIAMLAGAAVLVWRPVITATHTQEHTAELIALTDTSQSMTLPLHPERVSAKLDVAAAWDPDSCAGRNLAARTMHERLISVRDDAARIAQKLDEKGVEIEQGMPAGSETVALLSEYGTLLKTLRADLPAAASGLAPLLSGTEAVGDAELRTSAGDALTALDKSQVSLIAPPAAGAPLSAATLRSFLAPMAAFNASADRLFPMLDRLQDAADQKFSAEHKPALEKALAAAATRSRTDLAALARAALPTSAVAIDASGDPDQTDLYEQVTQALDARKDHVISHCVLFSDGAHNGAPDSPIAERLKKEGIQFITVGAGLPGARAAAPAVCDWRLRRALHAGKPATLRADIKATPGATLKLTLALHDQDDQALTNLELTATGANTPAIVNFKAPAEGPHVLKLSVAGTSDSSSENGSVLIQTDCIESDPRLLLIGSAPDWDTALMSAAAQREGCILSQVYAAGEAPKRGGLSRSVPSSLLQWTRFRAVILYGPAFTGFSAQDVKDLYEFVTVKGGTLLVISEDKTGFAASLAASFGWNEPPRMVGGALRIARAAYAFPCMKLGADGAQSARRFAALGRPDAAWRVPAQDVVLIESEQGDPVCSLGFYGRGKVIHWGLRGLYRMREYEKAASVDRLMENLIGELAASVFPGGDASVAVYPRLPQAGKPCQILLAGKPAAPTLKIGSEEVKPASSEHDRQRFVATPHMPALTIQSGSDSLTIPVHDNPGVEALYSEFNEDFLRRFAKAAGGDYLPALQARPRLAAITPQTYLTKSADIWRPGRSPLLLAWLALFASLHWIFRKLAGLAI